MVVVAIADNTERLENSVVALDHCRVDLISTVQKRGVEGAACNAKHQLLDNGRACGKQWCLSWHQNEEKEEGKKEVTKLIVMVLVAN